MTKERAIVQSKDHSGDRIARYCGSGCRAIDGIRPLLCISPLNVQLHFTSLYASILRIFEIVLKDNHESECLVEPYQVNYLASAKNRTHGLKRSTRYTPPEDVV